MAAKKGQLIVEGAKAFCSNSVANNSKGTAVPLKVTSQKQNLKGKKNKYFAQDKPVATDLDNTAKSFNNGEGFGKCILPDGKTADCKAVCKITFKDYYENVDFNASMKILLDASTGTCLGYGKTGTIQFADSGQTKGTSQIDVKEADPFTVASTSPQWEITTGGKGNAVDAIKMVSPLTGPPTGVYYFIKESHNYNNPLEFNQESYLTLNAEYKGDPAKIVWALYKGEGTNDKIKTFVGLGANFRQSLTTLFDPLEEGKYRIEAYMRKAGGSKCHIIIEYIKDHVASIKAPGTTLVKGVEIPITLHYKNEFGGPSRVLNHRAYYETVQPPPVAIWHIRQGNTVLYNTLGEMNSQLVSVKVVRNYTNLLLLNATPVPVAMISFANEGEYTIRAYTDPFDTSPVTLQLKVMNGYSVNTIQQQSKPLMRYYDVLKVKVGTRNVDFIPDAHLGQAQWYLQKKGVWLTAFNNSNVSKGTVIDKKINDLLKLDAGVYGGEYFGKYTIEAYARPLAAGKAPQFKGGDSWSFEVIRNEADKISLPIRIPKGAKVKYEAEARIMPLVGDEKLEIETPQGVTKNTDGTLTFTEEGEFEISTYLTGTEASRRKATTKVTVAEPEVKRALWAYGTGYKRTETGYKEQTHGFVEIIGLENQTLPVKIWLKGGNESFYNEPDKYLLDKKEVRLDNKGKGSFMINTNDTYKKMIDEAVPATAANPNPKHSLVFTIEVPATTGNMTLPADMEITNATPVIGTKFYEVLDTNEVLALTSEQKIKPIVFSTEDSKNVQSALTHYGKTHKIWVHTVNMQDEQVTVEVLRNVHSDCMEIKDGILTALESVKSYTKEKVGEDGLLELTFKVDNIYQSDAETNPAYYGIQVAKEASDPEDAKKKVLVWAGDQFIISPMNAPYIVRSADLKSIGIKTEATTLTKEEKIALRRRMLCFKNSALMVTDSTSTPEAVQNCDVLVTVDEIEEMKEFEMAEIDRNEICECEARIRAFMRLIMVKESERIAVSRGNSPYETNVGGLSFIKDYKKDYSTHPRVYVKSADSTAAGAYQILGWVYDQLNGWEIDRKTYRKTGVYVEKKDYVKKYKLPDFSPLSQDKLCLILLKHYRKGSIEAIISNNINKALDITSFEWASLPHNDKNYKTKTQWRYEGQHGQTLEEARNNYNSFLKEELEGKTKYLEIKKGFLKEFGYHCCKDTNSANDGKWRMPIDNPMLCLYSQGGAKKPWHGSFGEKIRDGSTNHTGTDLLAEPGTNVYACVKSKVHKIYTSTSLAGKVLVLKVIDVDTFKSLRNNSYVEKYKDKGELLEKSFNHEGDIYLTFWHLSKNDFFKEGDEVKHDDIVGLTGVSGYSGANFTTRNPHLHFEVSNVGSVSGLDNKCNPAVYFQFKTEDEMTEDEKDYQLKIKEKEWN